MRPRVSVGLPVYNGGRYLQHAIDSLTAQTFEDFELIISDNASTDDTEEICRAYAARDRRVIYMRQPVNVGVSRNFNLLVDHARAPYFKWASADDMVAPTLLERCLAIASQDPSIAIVHSRTRFIGADGEILPREDSGLHLMEERPSERLRKLWDNLGFCNAQYGIMRLDVLRRTQRFGTFVGADICFLAEMIVHGKFFEIDDYLLYRRFHPHAASNLSPEDLLEYYGLQRTELVLYHWRHVWENARAVVRAPIGATERARALALVLQRMAWKRHALGTELGFLVMHLLGRPYPVLGSIRRYSKSGPGQTQ